MVAPTQPGLFDDPRPPLPEGEAPLSRFEKWQVFHRENPIVFELFAKYAHELLAAGSRRISARMIGERIRYEIAVKLVETDDDFRINDHVWPYMSRLLAVMYPHTFGDSFVFKDERFDATSEEIIAFHRSLKNFPVN